MSSIAVIDTETTWGNVVMSIGVVIADSSDYAPLDTGYFVLDPEYREGGLFSHELFLIPEKDTTVTSRKDALGKIDGWFKSEGVTHIYAYNASFDKSHLREFSSFAWYDIMRLAAYKQYNPFIPDDAVCCKTGRLKRDYGVEPMTRLISGNRRYCEMHNALQDAIDELDIMRMLGLPVEAYEIGRI